MSDDAIESGKTESIASVRSDSRAEVGWRGRIIAALLGGAALSVLAGIAGTIYIPGFDGLDQAFTGGLILALVWPTAMLWILFARNGWRAWMRVLVPLAALLALDIAGLAL